MLAAYLHSVRESVNRRMALVLFGLAILFAVILFIVIKVTPLPDGTSMIFLGKHMLGPASLAVPAALVAEVQITGGLWLLLAIFASSPLLVSTMEKGWVELTFTKGVPRWKILMGSYFGGLTLYAMTLTLAMVPAAIYLWVKTGVGIQHLLVAIVFETFGFGALMALASLVTLTQTGVALPIIIAVFVDLFSPVLANRERGLFTVISSAGWRSVITFFYRILPKNFEIVAACENYIQYGKVGPWMPFWSTGIFIVVVLGLTMWLLHRKSL